MKKILLLGGIVLCVGFSLAQTTPSQTPSVSPSTPPVVAAKEENTMEAVERNIDRRLIYVNRYKKSDDMASLSKLVSDENKDFYINFMKYVKASPVFTLKRDVSVKIVKTPTEEYVIGVLMTVNGVDKKGAMTFLEEKTETGTRWLIIDSNLHISKS